MYSEGEDHYLKDLDWVNIVKSMRELKALSRIILNQHQRQILAFQNENVIPRSNALKSREKEFLETKVPFENWSYLTHFDYNTLTLIQNMS